MKMRSRVGLLKSLGNQVRKSPLPQSRQLPPKNEGGRASMLAMSVMRTRRS